MKNYQPEKRKKTSPQTLKFISETKANKKTKRSCNLFVTQVHVTVTVSQCNFGFFCLSF